MPCQNLFSVPTKLDLMPRFSWSPVGKQRAMFQAVTMPTALPTFCSFLLKFSLASVLLPCSPLEHLTWTTLFTRNTSQYTWEFFTLVRSWDQLLDTGWGERFSRFTWIHGRRPSWNRLIDHPRQSGGCSGAAVPRADHSGGSPSDTPSRAGTAYEESVSVPVHSLAPGCSLHLFLLICLDINRRHLTTVQSRRVYRENVIFQRDSNMGMMLSPVFSLPSRCKVMNLYMSL